MRNNSKYPLSRKSPTQFQSILPARLPMPPAWHPRAPNGEFTNRLIPSTKGRALQRRPGWTGRDGCDFFICWPARFCCCIIR